MQKLGDQKLGTKKIIVWMALPRRMTLWFFFALEFHNTSVEIMGGAEGTMYLSSSAL